MSFPFSNSLISRRGFVRASAATLTVSALPQLSLAAESLQVDESKEEISLQGRIFKTLKIGMTNKIPGTLADRFRAAKAAGFAGMEMDSPGMDVEKTRQAIEESGLPVDGTVCSTHWNIRHSSPDAGQRATALEHLCQAIRDTHAVGGNSVLLVAGKGEDGPEEEIWPRTVENIAKAVPLAAEKGVHIVIENVWNQFMYDHQGGSDQTADKFLKFVDEFKSPWVGMQFDIGNHWKYGSMGDWIRALGTRIHKLDLKGFSRATNKFTKIGEGDIDWVDVRAALLEINYFGWAAAEVAGGDFDRLKEVSANMDRVFNLAGT